MLVFCFSVTSASAYPIEFFDKLNKLPDYWQQDPSFGVNGNYYCGPVAAANSIMYFDTYLSGDIVPDNDWRNLVSTLSGDNYLKTDSNIALYISSAGAAGTLGTYFSDMISGIDKYLDEKFAPGFNVKNQWWDSVSIDWIKNELWECEDVIFLVGWYSWIDNEWKRTGGHYVTLAGYDDDEFWISDPWNAGPTHDRYTYGAWGPSNWELLSYNSDPDGRAMIEGVISASPIPEPVTLLLLGSGLLVIGTTRKHWQRIQKS